MKSIIIKAPAKINLYLDVINKRKDNYHNIETIFERLDLHDWIKISIIPKGIKLICAQNLGIPNINNTAYRAANLLIKTYNLKCGFKIEIDKRIPIAAGLGGGSSDAASTLLGINSLLNLKLKRQTLLNLAVIIGADVPFFVSGYKRAFATGIGEILTPLNQQQNMYFLLIAPPIRILTSNIYNRLNTNPARHCFKKGFPGLGLTKKGRNANISCHYFANLSAGSIKNSLFNKLEEVILPSYPVLRNIKMALKKAGAEGVLVSGSGPVVFGVFKSGKEAVRAESILDKKGNWQLFIARNY